MTLSGTVFRLKWIMVGIVIFGVAFSIIRYANDRKTEADHAATLEEHNDHGLERSVDEKGNVVWTCSMHPQIQLPEPGKCPICFMDLIKLELDADKGEQTSLRQVKLDTTARKLAEIVTTPVSRQSLSVDIRMVGKVEYDETRVSSITAWMGGRIDTMYVDSTGSVVKRGQPMASIYSPELLTAQAELVQAVKAIKELNNANLALVQRTAERTLEAAREKLRLLGFSKAQISAVIERGKPSDHVTLHATQSGVVIRKEVVEGMYVKTGQPIYTVADLSRVWVVLGAYESDLPWIKEGLEVEFQAEAHPGKTFTGHVTYIDPRVDEKTRTVDVRLEVANPSGDLKPGMFVQATQKIRSRSVLAGNEDPLVIPASAPLITGKRAVVYVAVAGKQGVYEGREIVLGPKAGNYYVVKNGLQEGEEVVSKGSFKIDSALQIMARPSMMTPSGAISGGGHDHGSSSASAKDKDMAPAFEAPEILVSKLYFVGNDLEAVSEALRQRNLEAGKKAYERMREKLDALDASSLEGDAKLQFKELSMLLKNDSVLGSEAKDYKRLHEVHALALEHYGRMSKAFGVAGYADTSQLAVSTPEAFKQAVGAVYDAYAPLSEALGNDDMEAARKAMPALVNAIGAVDSATLDERAQRVWMKSLSTMNDGLATMRTAVSLVDMRTGFELVSVGLIDAVSKLGVELDGPLFKLYCPMAFENKGATWLQQDENIRNPYFGAAMYKCGEVSSQLKAE